MSAPRAGIILQARFASQRLPGKALASIAGRPILERIVMHLVGQGVRRVFLAINYLGHIIRDHFGDGARLGARIEYLTDWAGIADWINREPVASHFELLVNDPRLNLAVLRRRNAVSVQP